MTKIGLVGTGYWAEVTHGRGLVDEPVEFVAIWGRNPVAAKTLGDKLGVTPCADYDVFLEQVDVVAFAIPPTAQVDLAIRAAQAGRHLLLEKPIALNVNDARRLHEAVIAAGVASIVNFTWRFNKDHQEWLQSLKSTDLYGAWARCFSDALTAGTPYETSGWRQEYGALWDVTPHVLSVLLPALGPVDRVQIDQGFADLVHLVFHHQGGASSTASLTLNAPTQASEFDFSFWGPTGASPMPSSHFTPQHAFIAALHDLLDMVADGRTEHPCDTRLGLAVVEILDQAQRALDNRV